MDALTPYAITPTCSLRVVPGDITTMEVDAIVNAANQRLLGGGGVDGAIHRAAGPELLEACRRLPEVRTDVRCPTGEARMTPGFRLAAKHIIHAVGPRYRETDRCSELLRSAYRSSLELARAHQLKTIAFPAISCGAYGYPHLQAVGIALATCHAHAGELEVIYFSIFDPSVLNAFGRGIRNFDGC